MSTGQIQNGGLEGRSNMQRIPANAQNNTLYRCHKWHQVIDHVTDTEEGVLDNNACHLHIFVLVLLLLRMLSQMKGDSPSEGSPKKKHLGRVQERMIVNKAKDSFRVELQASFVGGGVVRISITAVFDHKNIAFQVMIHLKRVW